MTTSTTTESAKPDRKTVAAHKLDSQIRQVASLIVDKSNQLQDLIAKAQQTNVHQTLGFPTWQAYVTDVASSLPPVRGKSDRKAMIRFLLGAGLSLRATAEIADVSKSTVENVKNESPETVKSAETVSGNGGKGVAQTRKSATDLTVAKLDAIRKDLKSDESKMTVGEVKTLYGALRETMDVLVDVLNAQAPGWIEQVSAKRHPASKATGTNPRTGTVAA